MREAMIYDTDVYQIRRDIIERMLEIIKSQMIVDTVFFGDSITRYMDIDKYFSFDSANCGIVGITSHMLLHFVDEGVIKYQPKRIFLMVGTNDMGNTVMAGPRQIAMNVKQLVEIIHENLPNAHIYLISCIPCVEEYHGYQYKGEGLRSNDILKMVISEYRRVIVGDYVTYLDVFDSLLDDQGKVRKDCFVDGLHLNEKGYQIYTEAIKKAMKS